MRIALISYECPPDTADGGIGTYIAHLAQMLSQRGHDVEVFAGSRQRSGSVEVDGVVHNRVLEPNLRNFRHSVAEVFSRRHSQAPFDVVEGPDFGADALDSIRRHPELAFVLRLHTPSSVLLDVGHREPGILKGLQLALRSVANLRPPTWGFRHEDRGAYISFRHFDRVEAAQASLADAIVSPSKALADEMIRRWRLDRAKVAVLPYPYMSTLAAASQARAGAPRERGNASILYIGRLGKRKGVLDIASAIPMVLDEVPTAKFMLVGPPDEAPDGQGDMAGYLRHRLAAFAANVEVSDPVTPDRVHALLQTHRIVLVPSHWENYPYSCIEAMAMGCAIVGTDAGGIPELIDHGVTGLIVQPKAPQEIAQAIVRLCQDHGFSRSLGAAARAHIDRSLSLEALAEGYEAIYAKAIRRRNNRTGVASV
jgi:glycosyltransferase involved in cell wall biosynthesis